MDPDRRYAAVVLAGGAGRRLGGAGKPVLPVAGTPMLHRVLAAAAGADPRVVVGPDRLPVPAGVARTREQPPGGGPVPALAAGLALVPADVPVVVLLAADLPLLTAAAVRRLRDAVAPPGRDAVAPPGRDAVAGRPGGDGRDPAARSGWDGAVFVDAAGAPQWLCGAWHAGRLRSRLAALGPDLAGLPVRRLLGELAIAQLADPGGGPPPWWDCDTDQDLRRAEALARGEEIRTGE